MLVGRGELLALMGSRGEVARGRARSFVLPGSSRRATVLWTVDGTLLAEVSETSDGDAGILVVHLDASYDDGEDAFEVSGSDRSGEASEWDDPRAAAAAWRRLVGPMEEVGERV